MAALAGMATLLAVRYREQQPTFIPPMLLTPGVLPSGDRWTFELKWDGCRAQLRYDGRCDWAIADAAIGDLASEDTSLGSSGTSGHGPTGQSVDFDSGLLLLAQGVTPLYGACRCPLGKVWTWWSPAALDGAPSP